MTDRKSANEVLEALEISLKRLEAVFADHLNPQTHAILGRRRRSIVMLRLALGKVGAPRLRSAITALPSVAEVIAAEWRLATRIGTLRHMVVQGVDLSPMLATLEAEVVEAALTLRLIEQRKGGAPPPAAQDK